MSSPNGPGSPDGPEQRSPQQPGPSAQPPHGGQYPQQAPPSPYAQYPPPPPYAQHPLGPAPNPKNKTLIWALAGAGLAIVLVVAAVALFTGNSRGRSGPDAQSSSKSASPHAGGPSQTSPGAGASSLLSKSPQELLLFLPAAPDFPAGTQVQPYINAPGEANADERVKPLPPEATNPPGCWSYLEVRKNRDDLADLTRIVTTKAKNSKGQTVAAAQIAKENNIDALEQAKTWLGQCQEFDYVYQLKPEQPPIHFQVAPLPGPTGFSDPFYGVKFTELGPQGPRGYEYFFATRIRGLLVLSEGVCDLSSFDENQNEQMQQQIPIMFSKVVQGLRNMQ